MSSRGAVFGFESFQISGQQKVHKYLQVEFGNSTQNVTIKAQSQNKSELPPDESYSSLNMFGNEFLSLLHIYAVL